MKGCNELIHFTKVTGAMAIANISDMTPQIARKDCNKRLETSGFRFWKPNMTSFRNRVMDSNVMTIPLAHIWVQKNSVSQSMDRPSMYFSATALSESNTEHPSIEKKEEFNRNFHSCLWKLNAIEETRMRKNPA